MAAALAAAEAAAQSLARGKEHLGVLERLRDEAKAEIVDEARDLAETFAESGVCAMIGGAAQRGREVDDELAGFQITLDILDLHKRRLRNRPLANARRRLPPP